jgi:hypothetical protein
MSKRKKPNGKTVIEGIQAETVQADVMAVGRGAKASKVITGAHVDSQEFVKAVEELRQALGSLNLNATQQGLVEEDVQELEEAAKKQQPDVQGAGSVLQSIVDKIRMAGIVVTEAVVFTEAARKLAELLGASLKGLG